MGGGRFLWMYTDGLTTELIHEEAKRLGLVSVIDLQGREAWVSAKLGDMAPEDTIALRDACYARIGITDGDEFERQRITKLPFYAKWKEDRIKNPPVFRHRRQ